MYGVNTPWNLNSSSSCLSHLRSHLSPQVPLSFVVWIELFLVNWIPWLQLLIPFHPSSVLLSYASSLAARPVCHQNESHQVSYNNTCINIMLCTLASASLNSFLLWELLKSSLKNIPSFGLSLFFLWPFWLILLWASTSLSLTLPRHPTSCYFLSNFYYLLVQVPVWLLCQWFIRMYFYFSAFCFSLVPYFTLSFRRTVLNALRAPNFKIPSWGQIKAVQSHYIHYCLGTSHFPPPLLW